MDLFLAYGNSDQESFRSDEVRAALDYLTVPGTIAAYYPDATSGFVLTSELSYIIDPRTPLFQSHISQPKASYYELAIWMGETVAAHMGPPAEGNPVTFGPDLYTRPVVAEMVQALVEAQRNYAGRAAGNQSKIDRYRTLLAQALPGEMASTFTPRPPAFVLAPYFAATSETDAWCDTNQAIWEESRSLEDSDSVSPVIAVTDVSFLARALDLVPDGLAETAFFWVTDLDERQVSEGALEALWQAVADQSGGRRLVNMYGSFFSVCLAYAGLAGLGHGMGYSEARSWPALSTTGAAPQRYYVRHLHMFLPPATAQLVVQAEPKLQCDCSACLAHGPDRIASLGYHDTKKHFALARRWELDTVGATGAEDVAAQLEDTAGHFAANVAPLLPARIVPDVGFLTRWAAVLERMAQP